MLLLLSLQNADLVLGSDLLLHHMGQPLEGSGGYYEVLVPVPNLPEAEAQSTPQPGEWRTPPLWGVADSAPYLHDGGARTLRDAILRHNGDAKAVTEAYRKLSAPDQEAVLAFLRTLKAPPDAEPVAVAAKR